MSDEQATLAATPRKTLVGFARVPLKAGESKNVTFTVTTQQLSLVVGKDGKREVRPGSLQIQVAATSRWPARSPRRLRSPVRPSLRSITSLRRWCSREQTNKMLNARTPYVQPRQLMLVGAVVALLGCSPPATSIHF